MVERLFWKWKGEVADGVSAEDLLRMALAVVGPEVREEAPVEILDGARR